MAKARNGMKRYAAAVAIVAASTGVAEVLYRLTHSTRLSVVFLAGVLVSAYLLGSGPAYLAAGLAFLAYNFYVVEPRFEINYGGPDDLITLAVFLFVAMLTGRLTGRIRDQVGRAESKARTTSALFDATRSFSGSSDEQFIRAELAHHLSLAAHGEAFVRDEGRLVTSPVGLAVASAVLRTAVDLEQSARNSPVETRVAGGWSIRPLHAGNAVHGVAGWRSDEGGADEPLLDIMADVGAAAIARARLAAAKAEVETRMRTEDLRNALLSSISHDLRTPLAAILASASSLAEFGESFDAATRNDLATTIQQEAERLDAFVANLLNMTRLEAGALTVNRIPFSVAEIITRVADRRLANASQRIEIAIAPDLPEALGDPVLFEQAFWNVFDNAVRYSPHGSVIRVSARPEADEVEVLVEDQGPGIPAEDLGRVFEKFFRSSTTAHKPGTGLGLSITKGLVEGMGGRVAAQASPDGGGGLEMTMTLPTSA